MKILLATGIYPPDIGGPATYSKLLSDMLPKEGIGVAVESFGAVRHLPKGIRHLAYMCRLLWSARKADLIFAQDTVSVGLPALVTAFILSKAFVIRVPGDYAWEQSVQRFGVTDSIDDFQKKKYGARAERLRRIQKLVVSQADLVIAPSVYFAGLVSKWTSRPAKTISIYNGIDVSEIKALAQGAVLRPKTIVSAGRLVPWKGFDMLIRSMKKLDGWKLEIAGDGPEAAHLREMIAREGLQDRAALLGRVGKEDLVRKIASAEIFALNTAFESFSFQVVEAMAAGAPVIATKVGNLAEIIDTGASGFLIERDSEAEFIAAATKISSDPALRKNIVEAARTKSERFSIAATIRATKAALASAEGASSPSRSRRMLIAKLFRYLFAGGVSAGTDLVALYLFTDAAHIWYVASSVLAFIIAFGVSFVMQKFFTFQEQETKGMSGQLAMYLGLSVTNLFINTWVVYLLVEYAGFHYLPAQIAASIVLAIESYVVYSMFIFKNKPVSASTAA